MRFFIKSLFVIMLLLATGKGYAAVQPERYGIHIGTSKATIDAKTNADMEAMLQKHPLLSDMKPLVNEQKRETRTFTFDFYIVFTLVLLFGLIRYIHPRYFRYLLRAFRSPAFGNKQLKDQMETAVLPNLLMNIFFAASGGVYLYYIFKLNFPQRISVFSPSVLVIVLIGGVGLLYLAKHFVMRFSGWAFNIHTMMGHYIYNVFLINKVIAIILLPFTVLLAFAQTSIAIPAMIVSLFLVGVLFINRYTRSWQVLGAFFQYSKFHFFAYLCASEILPMAILTKLLIRGIFY
ncbi:MAG: DUF4271 domain-containing protein [Chitinophagales bacterium]|nr:DUF4271 domain-containing protein [Chitinophagaceae bacterium]MCB9065153.1 DUF4271 domain-containing protein [Chitinophagales bacterium]